MLNIYTHNNNPDIQKDQTVEKAVKANGQGKKVSFESYVDPTEEFTSDELKWGIWYVKHKALLYKILVGLLIAINVVFWLFSLWKFGDYLIFGIYADEQMYKMLGIQTSYQNINANYTATPLIIDGVTSLIGGVNKSDAIAVVRNPNDHFVVSFDYYFNFGEATTTVQHAVLLAGEEGPLVAYGLTNSFGSGEVILQNVKWRRISPHYIADLKTWQDERLNFAVSDLKFIKRSAMGDIASDILNFKLTNNGPLGFTQPQFVLGLYNADSLQGVMPLFLENFKSQETRTLDLRSFANFSNITEVKVYPAINLFGAGVFIE